MLAPGAAVVTCRSQIAGLEGPPWLSPPAPLEKDDAGGDVDGRHAQSS